MKTTEEVTSLARDIVNHTDEQDWDKRELGALGYLGDYYRIQVDNNKELFTAELPQYVGQYTATSTAVAITELPEEYDIPAYVVRDMLQPFREWAFLHGYRDNESQGIVPLEDYKDDSSREVLQLVNGRIENEQLCGQDGYLALSLVHEAVERSGDNGAFESIDDALVVINAIARHVDAVIEAKQEGGEVDYNKLGGVLDVVYNQLHHEALETLGERRAARKIRDGEASPEDFL